MIGEINRYLDSDLRKPAQVKINQARTARYCKANVDHLPVSINFRILRFERNLLGVLVTPCPVWLRTQVFPDPSICW